MFAILDSLLPLVSLGLGIAEGGLTDASGLVTRIPSYEIFAQGYFSTSSPHVFLRPAVRFSYAPSQSFEQPQAVALAERTFKGLGEVAILYNGLLVPALTVHAGWLRQKITLDTNSFVQKDAHLDLSRTENLWQFGLTLGLGLPMAQGRIVIEPFYRLVRIEEDQRQQPQWGVDLSIAIPVTEQGRAQSN